MGSALRDVPGPRGGAAGYEEKRYDGEVTRNAASYVPMMHQMVDSKMTARGRRSSISSGALPV